MSAQEQTAGQTSPATIPAYAVVSTTAQTIRSLSAATKLRRGRPIEALDQ
jgi:hypothetical protein